MAAAQPPQASPVSQAHATYTHGQDAGDLAARARELGLERRAALLEASRQRHSLYGGTLKSTRLRLVESLTTLSLSRRAGRAP